MRDCSLLFSNALDASTNEAPKPQRIASQHYAYTDLRVA
jgi:hypothetical protein